MSEQGSGIQQHDLLEILRIVSQRPGRADASAQLSQQANGAHDARSSPTSVASSLHLQQWTVHHQQQQTAQAQHAGQQASEGQSAVHLLTTLLSSSSQQQARAATDAGASLAAILQPLVASRASEVVQGSSTSSSGPQAAAVEAAFEVALQTISSHAQSNVRDVKTALERLCVAMGLPVPKIQANPLAGGQFHASVLVGDSAPVAERTLDSAERAILAALTAALVRACQHARERFGVGTVRAQAAAASDSLALASRRSAAWGASASGSRGAAASAPVPFFPRGRGPTELRPEWFLEGPLCPQIAEESIPYPSPLRPTLFHYQDQLLYNAMLEVKPSDHACALRQQFVQRIVDAIEAASPTSEATLFGSVVTGTDVLASDVNVSVSDPAEADGTRLMALVLPRVAEAAVGPVSALATPWGPMMRVTATFGAVCNVLLNVEACLRSTRLVARFVERLPELIPLTRVLKRWRWRRAIPDGDRGLPSYAWSIMAIAYLVARPRSARPPPAAHPRQSRRAEDMSNSMFELLRGFFQAYASLPESGSHVASGRRGLLRRQGVRGWLTVENPEAEMGRAVPQGSALAIACVPSDGIVRAEIVRAANLLTEASKNHAIIYSQFFARRSAPASNSPPPRPLNAAALAAAAGGGASRAGQIQAVLGAIGPLAGGFSSRSPPAPTPPPLAVPLARGGPSSSPTPPLEEYWSKAKQREWERERERERDRDRSRSPYGSDEEGEDGRSPASPAGPSRRRATRAASPPSPSSPPSCSSGSGRPHADGPVRLAEGRFYRFGAGTPASPYAFAEVTRVEAPRTGVRLPACSTRDAGVRVHLRFYEASGCFEGALTATLRPVAQRHPGAAASAPACFLAERAREGGGAPGPPLDRAVLMAAECRAAGVLELRPPDARQLPEEGAFEVRASFLRPPYAAAEGPHGERTASPTMAHAPPEPAPRPARAPPPAPEPEPAPSAEGLAAVEDEWELEGSIGSDGDWGGGSSPPASPAPLPAAAPGAEAAALAAAQALLGEMLALSSAAASGPPLGGPPPPTPPPCGPAPERAQSPAGEAMEVSDGDGAGEEAGSDGRSDASFDIVIDCEEAAR